MARESPELLERYEKGEFKSVRAAAKEAGIVKDPTPQEKAEKAVSKAPDKPQVILAAWNECEQKERQAVLQMTRSGGSSTFESCWPCRTRHTAIW